MKYETPDPRRDKPDVTTCYEANCDNLPHPRWVHATSWDQVEEWLDHGLLVIDRDGDKVREVNRSRNTVILDAGGGEYGYQPEQVLLEDYELVPPTSPEEEEDAMASIMEAMKNNRLT